MAMNSKVAMRAASRIHARLRFPSPSSSQLGLPDTMWGICESKARRIEKAERRRWFAAARQIRDSLRVDIDILRERLFEIRCRIPDEPAPHIPTPKQIFEDLVALEGEFDAVDIDMRKEAVSATTDAIEFEGVDLGPFTIALYWSQLGNQGPYDVIAVDPRPAGYGNDVVHPHVQGRSLCEGDARVPIRLALEQGRLFDFFLVVRQTLETYNPASAHADLVDWTGRSCADCGSSMSEDESYSCERCSSAVCGECELSCAGCSSSLCGECRTYCERCDQSFCSPCLDQCSDCKADCCKECLNDEFLCRKCVDGAADADDDADAETPLHADGVGETGVPA